jgi:two-component system cell cycle sensor histidine kinase/response regulator CckA
VGRVLVVDEAAGGACIVAQMLRGAGFEVIETPSGDAALLACQQHSLDAVVLNLVIPELKCFEISRGLKAASPQMLPLLYLSSRTSREARVRALDAGVDGYLAHPFDARELRASVAALVRLKRQELKNVLEAARHSMLGDALDALADSVALLGHDGEIVAVNRAWTELARKNSVGGVAADIGASYAHVFEHVCGATADEAFAATEGVRQVLAGTVATFETDFSCSSLPEERWFRLTARSVSRESPMTAIATLSDRTSERLAARAELGALVAADTDRRRLQATLEALPVGVWLSDAKGAITHTNPAAAAIWGGSAPLATAMEDYAVYRGWTSTGESVAPEDWTLARTLRTGETIVGELFEIERFDGTRGHILISSAPILDSDGRIIGGVVVNVDITERQRLSASLEAERSRLEMIFDLAPSFLAVLSGPDFVFERVNPAYLQLVGHRDPVGKALLDALPELTGQGFVELLDTVRITGTPFIGTQLPVKLSRTPDAPPEQRYVDLVYQRLVDDSGQDSVIAHGVDVTDQVVASALLQQSEQRLREQFAKMPVATYLWEARGDDFVMIDCNEAAVRMFPAYGSAAIGRTFSEIFPALGDLGQDYRRSLRDNVVMRRTVEFDNGEHGRKLLELTIGPKLPHRVLVHAVDMTERAELESQLRQAQKMDAVGRLAGGVAHDFNNLLTVIGAHTSFLLESIDSGDARHDDAEEIQKAAIRAAGLTRQLLAFSRKQILKPTVLDLNAIIAEASKMLERLLGEDIEIVTHLADDLGAVVADSTQLDQVLINLAVNARDAMPDGGVLTITSRNTTIVANVQHSNRVIPAGDYTVLEMSDTGVGMDAEMRARLFEPFFTTKETGKGTGLGLATVYGIVKQSAGYIMVESILGAGTTFQIYLPVAHASHEDNDVQTAENVSVRGVETVLLIEDEVAVREIANRILKRKGYVVLLASSGEDALAVSAAFHSPIHLVISDAVMPGMCGAEVVRRLQEQRPGLKALFMSGYTDDEILRRGIVSSTAAFIQKPFTLDDFTRAAREALDR